MDLIRFKVTHHRLKSLRKILFYIFYIILYIKFKNPSGLYMKSLAIEQVLKSIRYSCDFNISCLLSKKKES